VPQMIGANLGPTGAVEGYPELSVFSFSSADPKSPYANAYWTGDPKRGAMVQQARLAWDRLRNVLDLDVSGAGAAAPGRRVPISIRVTNSGSGHKFPTGFPEGRIAWLAVSAFDLGTGRELEIYDSAWKRSARGVGRLTQTETLDPNFPRCGWSLPPGSPDPFAIQFKAVASLGDGCPTLDLMYAHALNLVVNRDGQPVDANGRVIDRKFPQGLPQFKDLDGDGDLYDDSFLRDTRLDPLPLAGASLKLDRYAVVIPHDATGPVAVTAAVYYQSVEAMVALKFLGNLADTDRDRQLEPCVLGGACDGRTSSVEPAVVEGSPPVPMEVRSMVIHLGHAAPRPAPQPTLYPRPDATGVYRDVVVKATFAEPVRGLDQATFTLQDASGVRVPASVDQIGDSTWGLFPHGVFLKGGETYTAEIAANVCGVGDNCSRQPLSWRFTTSATKGEGRGDTRVSLGFGAPAGTPATLPVAVKAVDTSAAGIVVTFSAPVVNVTAHTFRVGQAVAGAGCENARPVPGKLGSNPAGDVWTYEPLAALDAGATYCVLVTTGVYDMAGRNLTQPFSGPVSQRTQATRRTSIPGEPHARSSDQQP
jgi:hypothetical protein